MLSSYLLKRENDGVTGALPYNPVEYTILAACSAIAWAYTIELDLLVLYTFRRRKGLYFWSLLISSWGCSLHALGFILKFLVGTSPGVYLPFVEIGWVSMVTGQSFVLFSRLHLVVRSRRTLRLVLLMIVFDAFALHVPTILFTVGSQLKNADFWVPKFNIMERIQLTMFCLQEIIISTIYIMATVRLLGSIYHSMTRKVMLQLVLIMAICIGMDIILIVLEFTNNYVGEAASKPLIYAIKLRLEFIVLNQLMGLTKAGFTEENNFQGTQNGGHELHQNRTQNSEGLDPEHGGGNVSGKKASTWSTARIRSSFSHATDHGTHTHPDHIFQTKQVEVLSQPKSPSAADMSDSSDNTAVGTMLGDEHAMPHLNKNGLMSNSKNDLSPMHNPSNAKINSLMGTAIVQVPAADVAAHQQRSTRRSRVYDPDGREASPVSEGEKGILRRSQDSEKEGTRWIDRFDA